MPFDLLFWRGPERADESGQKSWNVSHGPNDRGEAVVGTAAEAAPQGIKGFITALPVLWTSQESSNTEFALAAFANNELGGKWLTTTTQLLSRCQVESAAFHAGGRRGPSGAERL